MRKSHHALVLLLVLCLLIQPLSVSAFEFETPETAAELIEAVPGKTALAADIDIPTEDETLGKLVWYNNFDETDASTATYAAGAYTAGAIRLRWSLSKTRTAKRQARRKRSRKPARTAAIR